MHFRRCLIRCSNKEVKVLELDDIQYIILTRAPALVGRYEFLTFQNPEGGQAWLAGISEKVHSVEKVRAYIR